MAKPRVYLSATGKFLRVEHPQLIGNNQSITFSHNAEHGGSVSGIYVCGHGVVSISYDKGQISGVFPGKAFDKVEVIIG
ncbi:MAG: hypothetical protein MUC28_04205 [Planctomycetes bacterium]|jgi:hypothetical protein|nr:hypothetical protein [Planctomycetota bacterium]